MSLRTSGSNGNDKALPKGPFSGLYNRTDADSITCSESGITLRRERSADPAKYGSPWYLRQVFPNGGSKHISTLWGAEFEASSLRYRIVAAGNDQFLVTVIRKVRHRQPRGGWGEPA